MGKGSSGDHFDQGDPPSLEARLAAADETVLNDILVHHGPAIISCIRRKRYSWIKCAEDLNDILADALFQLWLRKKTFDPERASLRSWFYLLAQHRAIDEGRRAWQKMRVKEVNSNQGTLNQIPTRYFSFHIDDHTAKVLPKQILEYINKLSVIDQQILQAATNSSEGDSWAADLAGKIPLTAGNIRVRWSRIRKHIKQILDKSENPISLPNYPNNL
jgi:RNA polymerase sigma factor (sigma-70 family)